MRGRRHRPERIARLNVTASPQVPAPLGHIEPHAPLLRLPPEGQLLYKVMTAENLLRSIKGGYLHFNRVDSYTDLSNGDPHDGEQPPGDRSGHEMLVIRAQSRNRPAAGQDEDRSVWAGSMVVDQCAQRSGSGHAEQARCISAFRQSGLAMPSNSLSRLPTGSL